MTAELIKKVCFEEERCVNTAALGSFIQSVTWLRLFNWTWRKLEKDKLVELKIFERNYLNISGDNNATTWKI